MTSLVRGGLDPLQKLNCNSYRRPNDDLLEYANTPDEDGDRHSRCYLCSGLIAFRKNWHNGHNRKVLGLLHHLARRGRTIVSGSEVD